MSYFDCLVLDVLRIIFLMVFPLRHCLDAPEEPAIKIHLYLEQSLVVSEMMNYSVARLLQGEFGPTIDPAALQDLTYLKRSCLREPSYFHHPGTLLEPILMLGFYQAYQRLRGGLSPPLNFVSEIQMEVSTPIFNFLLHQGDVYLREISAVQRNSSVLLQQYLAQDGQLTFYCYYKHILLGASPDPALVQLYHDHFTVISPVQFCVYMQNCDSLEAARFLLNRLDYAGSIHQYAGAGSTAPQTLLHRTLHTSMERFYLVWEFLLGCRSRIDPVAWSETMNRCLTRLLRQKPLVEEKILVLFREVLRGPPNPGRLQQHVRELLLHPPLPHLRAFLRDQVALGQITSTRWLRTYYL